MIAFTLPVLAALWLSAALPGDAKWAVWLAGVGIVIHNL